MPPPGMVLVQPQVYPPGFQQLRRVVEDPGEGEGAELMRSLEGGWSGQTQQA
jgi:hypothetical protein